MKRKLFFKTSEEIARLSTILRDTTKKVLRDTKFVYECVNVNFQVGYEENNPYEYFTVYINEAKSNRQFFLTVDMDKIEKKGFYRKLKRSLKVLTKGIDLR